MYNNDVAKIIPTFESKFRPLNSQQFNIKVQFYEFVSTFKKTLNT